MSARYNGKTPAVSGHRSSLSEVRKLHSISTKASIAGILLVRKHFLWKSPAATTSASAEASQHPQDEGDAWDAWIRYITGRES